MTTSNIQVIKQEILLKHKVSRSVMLFIDMVIHSKQENPSEVMAKAGFYHQGCTMKKPTMYLETTTLLRTNKFTTKSSENKKANKQRMKWG